MMRMFYILISMFVYESMPLSKLMCYTPKVCVIYESKLYFRFLKFLFGCAGSWLWHAGSLGRVCGIQFPVVHFCSVAKLCPDLCDPMNCSITGFPVLHHLPEFAQTHVHWICDAIQPSHPLFPPSPLALTLSQYQGLFLWVSSSHQVAKVLELQEEARRSNKFILKEISPACSLEGLMLKRRVNSLEKTLMLGGMLAGGEGDDRGWDGWMASPTRWAWVWVDSGSWWWTGRPGVLRFMGSQRVGHDWATEQNWSEPSSKCKPQNTTQSHRKVHILGELP